MDKRTTPDPRWPWLLGWSAVGFCLRIRWILLAASADEVGNLRAHATAWEVLVDSEGGVNPPLLRLWMNLWPTAQGVLAGRVLSLVAGTLAILGVGALVTRVSRSSAWGLLAAAGVALHPWAVAYGATARAYALLLMAVVVCLGGVVRWLDDPADRWGRAAALGGAVLTAHAHYLGLGVLAGIGVVVGVRRPRLLVVPAVGVVSVLPWLGMALWQPSNRILPGGDPGWMRMLWAVSSGLGGGGVSAFSAGIGVLVLGCVLAAFPRERLGSEAAVLLGAGTGWVAAATVAGSFTAVRPAIFGAGSGLCIVVLTGIAGAHRWSPRALAWTACVLGLLELRAWPERSIMAARQDAPRRVSAVWEPVVKPAGALSVVPSWGVAPLVYARTGAVVSHAALRCEEGAQCATVDGVRLVGRDVAAPGLVLSAERPLPGCDPVPELPGVLWRCPDPA